MLLASVILLSCKKSSNSSSNNQQISHAITGAFAFNLGNTSINEETDECLLVQNKNYFVITGISSTEDNSFPYNSIVVYLVMPSSSLSVGTYSSSSSSNYVQFDSLHLDNPPTTTEFFASSQYPKTNITFTIDSFNTTTKYIHCNFSGTIENTNDSTTRTITNGTASGIVQYYTYNQ